MAAVPPEDLSDRKVADAALAPAVPDAGVRLFLLQNLLADERRWRLNVDALVRGADGMRAFPALHAAPTSLPALFVAGAKSDFLTADHHAAVRQLFPAAEFESLPTGHWVHAEAPDAFADLVCRFARPS